MAEGHFDNIRKKVRHHAWMHARCISGDHMQLLHTGACTHACAMRAGHGALAPQCEMQVAAAAALQQQHDRTAVVAPGDGQVKGSSGDTMQQQRRRRRHHGSCSQPTAAVSTGMPISKHARCGNRPACQPACTLLCAVPLSPHTPRFGAHLLGLRLTPTTHALAPVPHRRS